MPSWKKVALADVTNTFTSDQIVDSGTTSRLIINSSTHNASVANEARLQLGFGHSGAPDAVGYIKLTENATNSFDGTITVGVPYNNGSGGSATRDALTIRQTGDVTFFQHANFPDNGKAFFGASNDLGIYHNGTHSVIDESGTGNLIIYQGSNTAVFSPTTVTINRNTTFNGDVTISKTDALLNLTSGASNDSVIRFNQDTTQRATIGYDDTGDLLKINNNSNFGGTNHLTIDTTGNATFSGTVQLHKANASGLTDYIAIRDSGTSGVRSGLGLGTADSSLVLFVDKNNAIGSGSALVLQTGGTDALTINGSQNVAIGSSGSGYRLDVRGTGGTFFSQTTATSGSMARLRANNGSTSVLQINADGNIGIGTESPASLLHIEGDTPTLNIRDSSAFSAGTGGAINFQGKDSNQNVKAFAQVQGISKGANNGELILQTRNAGTLTTALNIDSSQNATFSNDVILGGDISGGSSGHNIKFNDSGSQLYFLQLTRSTTSLTTVGNVEIGGNIEQSINTGGGNLNEFRNTNTGTNAYSEHRIVMGTGNVGLRLGSSYNYSNADWNNAWVYAVARDLKLASSNGKMDFYVNGSTASDIALTIATNKKVGINTTSPSDYLHVVGAIKAQDGSSGVDYTRMFHDGTNGHLISNRGQLRLGAQSDDDAITIDSSGKVGIGITNPADYYSNKLVVGNLGHNDGITLASASASNSAYIMWADGTSGNSLYQCQVGYSHDINRFGIWTNATNALLIDSSQNTTLAGNLSLSASSPQINFSGSSGDYGTFGWTEGDPDVFAWRFHQNSGLTASITMDAFTENTAGGRIEFNSGASEVAIASIDSGGVFLGRDAVGQNTTTELGGYGVLSSNGQRYGNYGWLTFNAPTTNFTASSRGWALTNGYQAHSFAILKSNTASTEPSLTTNGEVGSGTTAPLVIDNVGNTTLGANLSVNGNLVTLEKDIGGNASYVRMNYNMPNSTDDAYGTVGMQRTSSTTYLGMLISSDSRDGIRFNTANGTPVERMRINASGNVGIGTSSLTSPAGVGRFLKIAHTSHAGICLQDTNSTAYDIYSADGHVYFYSQSLATNTVKIEKDGNVGIGTTSPSELLTVSHTSDTNKTRLKIVGGTKGFTLGKTGQAQSYVHLRPMSNGQVMAMRLMPHTGDQDTYLELWGHDYETDTTNFARGMLIIKQSDGNAFQIVSDANGSESVGPIEFVIENGSEPSMSVKTDGTVAINKNTDGVTGALTISNNQASASSSTNEAVQMLFGLSGQNDSGVIRVGKDEDYTSVGATSSFMSFYTKADGTTSEVMRFRKHIGLGILTTNPQANLHIHGSSGIRLTDSNQNSNEYAEIKYDNAGNTNLYINNDWTNSNALINFQLAGSTKMVVRGDGKVGIGTTNPSQLLSLYGGSMYMNTGQGITWNNGDAQIGAISGYHFQIKTYTGSALTEKMRIQSNGNVGIGTTSPSNLLHVEGAKDSDWIAKFKNTGTTNAYGLQIDTTANTTVGELALGVYTGTGTGMFVTSNGKTGIGTTSPDKMLHVSSSDDVLATFESTDTHATVRLIDPDTSNEATLTRVGDNLEIVKDGGNVSIGKDNPTQALDVQGSIISSGVLLAPTYATFIHSFTDDMGTVGHYIPWNSSAETTGNDFSATSFVVPMNMTLKRLYVRIESITNIGSHTLTATLISKPDGSISNTTVATASKSLNAASSGRNQKFTDSQFSNPPTLSRGQMGSIKLKFGSDIGGSTDFFITSVWEMDNNTI